jgi:hypothetical protein
MPLPKVPDPSLPYAAADLIPAYTTLVQQQLGDLTARLAKLPGQTPDERAPVLAGARAAFRAGLAQPGDKDWREKLTRAVEMTDGVERVVDGVAPKPGGGQPMAFGAGKFSQLKSAVQMACVVPERAKDDTIMKVFRAPAEWVAFIRPRLNGISKILKDRLEQTRPDVVRKAGFVLDPSLPDTMWALAMGSSEHQYIRVKPATLPAGGLSPDLSDDLAMLAAALLHEATHLLPNKEATFDFAYRKGGLFLALPPVFAAANAANYEEVAIRVLDPDQAVVVPGGDETNAMLALQVKVTRAWVRANDLTSLEADPEQRGLVAALIQADPAKVGPEVSAALLGALFGAMEGIMRLITEKMTLTFAAQAGLTPGPDGAVLVTVARATPTTAAAAALPLVCRRLADTGRIGFRSEVLVPYIDGISRYDRPGLATLLPDLLGQLDRTNK